MDIFLLIVIIFLFIAGAVVIFFTLWSFYANIKTKVPWARTPEENVERVLASLKIPKDSLIYDLGCGDGRVLFQAEGLGYQAQGYELSLYPYIKAIIKKLIRNSKVVLVRGNFLDKDLSKADAVFVFLTTPMIKKVSAKLKKELKPGTVIMSYGFEFPGWQIERIIETNPSKTYVYKI